MLVKFCFCMESLCWLHWGSARNLCAAKDEGQPRDFVPAKVLGLPGVSVLVRLGICLGSWCWSCFSLLSVVVLLRLEVFLGSI